MRSILKRKLVVGLLIFICFLLQCTVFHAFAFGSIVPNLMLILTASFGFMRGEKSGLLIGFFSGLFIDIFFGEVLGFYALLYMYIGYTNGKFNRIFYPEDIKLPMALIIVSDLFYGVTCYILLFLMLILLSQEGLPLTRSRSCTQAIPLNLLPILTGQIKA